MPVNKIFLHRVELHILFINKTGIIKINKEPRRIVVFGFHLMFLLHFYNEKDGGGICFLCSVNSINLSMTLEDIKRIINTLRGKRILI